MRPENHQTTISEREGTESQQTTTKQKKRPNNQKVTAMQATFAYCLSNIIGVVWRRHAPNVQAIVSGNCVSDDVADRLREIVFRIRQGSRHRDAFSLARAVALLALLAQEKEPRVHYFFQWRQIVQDVLQGRMSSFNPSIPPPIHRRVSTPKHVHILGHAHVTASRATR